MKACNARKWWKTTIGLISKNNFARAAHFFCTFLCRCFAGLQRETSRNFLVTRFYGGNVVRVPVHFFSLPLIFTLHWSPLAFLILSPSLQNFNVVLPTKKVSFRFLSLALNPCRPFSRWASLACRPLSLFLCLSLALYSKFVDMTIYLSFNTLDKSDTETICAFHFCLYRLCCCLWRRWLCDFPPKKPPVAFGLPYLLIELFYVGMPGVWTDGLSGGRVVYGHMITKINTFFYPWCSPGTLSARELC